MRPYDGARAVSLVLSHIPPVGFYRCCGATRMSVRSLLFPHGDDGERLVVPLCVCRASSRIVAPRTVVRPWCDLVQRDPNYLAGPRFSWCGGGAQRSDLRVSGAVDDPPIMSTVHRGTPLLPPLAPAFREASTRVRRRQRRSASSAITTDQVSEWRIGPPGAMGRCS